MISNSSESEDKLDNDNKYETNKKVEVKVIDFSSIERTEIENWCSEKK